MRSNIGPETPIQGPMTQPADHGGSALRGFVATLDWGDPDAASLLRDYGAAFGQHDDATLVIHGGEEAQVAPAAEALGDRSPDMWLVDDDGLRVLAPRAAAVLSTREADGPLGDRPWLGAGQLRSLYDRRLPGPDPLRQRFTCNLCGSEGVAENRGWPRDTATCAVCGSAARFRCLAGLVGRELFGTDTIVPFFPHRPDLAGAGMSDHPTFAHALGRRMSYTNTFYHQEPRLDVCAPGAHAGRYDLVVCSEVFEHVPPPLAPAWAGLFALLRPGGLLVFSVPYRAGAATREHYPDLHRYDVCERDGGYVLRNVTRAGVEQEFTDLVFHGGPGETLELRLFGLDDVLGSLAAAGFCDVRVRREPNVEHGVWWPGPDGWPITARRPG
jgi:SAM-dependent methyltransferase